MARWVLCGFLVGFAAGCSDPLSQMTRLADVELQDTTETASAVALPSAGEDNRPLFERLLGPPEDPVADAVAEAVQSLEAEATLAEPKPKPKQEQEQDASKRPSLFGLLTQKAKEVPRQEADTAAPETALVEASFAPETQAREPRKRGGLFSRQKATVLTGPDAKEIAPGTELAFGEIARVCALPKAAMGREVERAGTYKLYDSAAGSKTARAFYITGFEDGCPRQVTGAMALFGSASSHEAMRYGAPFEGKPYSDTDKAYEAAKKQTCGVSKGKPCGAKLAALEKTTVFLTIYDQFVDARSWHNVLLHEGAVLAMQ